LRLTTLCGLAAVAQLSVGGRGSLGSAAVVASLAVLGMTLVAAQQPLAPADGTIRFLPIPALTGLAFACLVSAALGRPEPVHAALPLRDSRSAAIDATGPVGAEGYPAADAWSGAGARDVGAAGSA
jgi:hypothetical protein